MSQGEQRIITIYPELTSFEVEWDSNKYNCNNCSGIGDCCGTIMDHNNKSVCEKCRCQHLHNVTDDTRKKGKVKQQTCQKCKDENLSKDYCESNGYLENNLKPQIVDCSNNFLVTGANNTIDNVSMKTECNINNEDDSINVFNTNNNDTSVEQQQIEPSPSSRTTLPPPSQRGNRCPPGLKWCESDESCIMNSQGCGGQNLSNNNDSGKGLSNNFIFLLFILVLYYLYKKKNIFNI